MNILRAVYPQNRNVYYVCLNSVKVTDKWRDAAHFLTHLDAQCAAEFLCDREVPYLPICSMADFYITNPGDVKVDQLYVLQNTDDGTYFVAASLDGSLEVTENINEAAHYLSEAAAEDAKSNLESFEHTYFDVEPHGFWSEE